jgi:hypothetical protein
MYIEFVSGKEKKALDCLIKEGRKVCSDVRSLVIQGLIIICHKLCHVIVFSGFSLFTSTYLCFSFNVLYV